jgi:hypothetical protein
MASPFPGMDPFLEDPAFWRDFHHEFIGCWRDALADQLPETYEARLDETVDLVPMDEATRKFFPDVAGSRTRQAARSRAKGAGTLLLEPVTIPHEFLDEERQARIHILHRPDRKLVTVLELLSPTNKNGAGFDEYRGKRRALLQQKINLVELDRFLGGTRPPLARPLPDGEYYVYVSRLESRPNGDVSAWTIRQPLPTISVPLHAPDNDVNVDLAEVFRAAYQRGRYARSLSYAKKPLAPLRKPDLKWAARLAAKK